jgi:predicted component of type VI protein secretion system
VSEERARRSQPRGDSGPTPPDGVPRELDDYLRLTAIDPEPGFMDRVMAAVEAEPPPRSGLLGWLGAAGPGQRLLQATLLAGALAVILAGLILGGSFFDLLRPHPASSVAPIVSGSPSPSPTPTLVPSPTPSATPPASPTAHPTPPESRQPTHTPEPSDTPTESPSAPEASASETPRASSIAGASSGGPGRN